MSRVPQLNMEPLDLEYRLDIDVPEKAISGTARVYRALDEMVEQWRKSPAVRDLEHEAASNKGRDSQRARKKLEELRHAASFLIQQCEKRSGKIEPAE